jgi:uncharacterized protein (UPF0262 family)
MAEASAHRLVEIELDEKSLPSASSDAEHERRVAIFDILEDNKFEIDGVDAGPYTLKLSIIDQRLVFDVIGADGAPARAIILSLTPFRRVIKDYFMICESYYEAIRHATPQQIEAIDMGRRGLHNEGSELLEGRLAGKVKVDFDTARRLFTLICALHVRN